MYAITKGQPESIQVESMHEVTDKLASHYEMVVALSNARQEIHTGPASVGRKELGSYNKHAGSLEHSWRRVQMEAGRAMASIDQIDMLAEQLMDGT